MCFGSNEWGQLGVGTKVTSDGKAYALWENEWGEGGVSSNKYLDKFTPMVGGGKWGPPQ